MIFQKRKKEKKKPQNFYGFSFRIDANPVTILAPLSRLFGLIAGGCQAVTATAAFSPSLKPFCGGDDEAIDSLSGGDVVVSSPNIISKSPQSVSVGDCSLLEFSISFCDGIGGLDLMWGESHLALMYSAFLHGGKCIPFFFKLCLAASDTIETIWPRRSGLPTKIFGSNWRIALYIPVERAISNSDLKSMSISNLSPSTITSMYSYSPTGRIFRLIRILCRCFYVFCFCS